MNVNEVKDFMAKSQSMDEWLLNEEKMRLYHGGTLPDWWQSAIIDSGFAEGQRLSFDSQLQHSRLEKPAEPPTD